MSQFNLESNRSYRPRHAALEKKRIVEETYLAGNSVSYVARQHGISPGLLYKWRQAMEEGALTAVACEEPVVSQQEIKKLKNRVRELEAALGRKTLTVEILKEAVKLGREKKLISRQPLVGVEDFE